MTTFPDQVDDRGRGKEEQALFKKMGGGGGRMKV